MFCARNVGPPPTEQRPVSLNILSTVVLTNLPKQVPPVARTTDNNINTTTNVVLKPTPSGSTSDTTGKETAATHGDIECSRDSQLDNDDDMKHPDDDDGLPTKHPKDDDGISTDSEDEDCDEVQKIDESEQLCATTMLAFAAPKQPSTDPLEIFTQRMEEMQRSFTQQLQDLKGQLLPEKKTKTQQTSASSHGCFEQSYRWYLFGKPPAAPP